MGRRLDPAELSLDGFRGRDPPPRISAATSGAVLKASASKSRVNLLIVKIGGGEKSVQAVPVALPGLAATRARGGAERPRARHKAGPPRVVQRFSAEEDRLPYIIPLMSGMPPPPPESLSGTSATIASVVRMFLAIDAAFWSAERVTMAGSMTPAATRSTYSPVAALRPWPTRRGGRR